MSTKLTIRTPTLSMQQGLFSLENLIFVRQEMG